MGLGSQRTGSKRRKSVMPTGGFKPIDLEDKPIFDHCLGHDPPQTSELSFTNFFMWRHYYHPVWKLWEECLLILFQPKNSPAFGLPPVGAGDKAKALYYLCQELMGMDQEVRVCRVGEDFVDSFVDSDRYEIIADRDNSDYVYLAKDLATLPGRKYHKKKNHLNRFLKNTLYEYRALDTELVECFLDMQEAWCQMKACVEKSELLAEDYAVYEALTHFDELDYQGGAIVIDSKVEAFSLGEALNESTAVIHIEKANPEIPGLYTAINQLFCQHAWSKMVYINREQDLGVEGLRTAKESYHPHHMVDKYTVIPRG
jgi:hypothetical protein